MRSRYSAFVLGLHSYLLDTWHASTRPATLEPLDPAVRWLGLDVRHASSPVATGPVPEAEVEFVARHKLHGRAFRLHETSRFVCEQGRWYYVSGTLHSS